MRNIAILAGAIFLALINQVRAGCDDLDVVFESGRTGWRPLRVESIPSGGAVAKWEAVAVNGADKCVITERKREYALFCSAVSEREKTIKRISRENRELLDECLRRSSGWEKSSENEKDDYGNVEQVLEYENDSDGLSISLSTTIQLGPNEDDWWFFMHVHVDKN